MAIYLPCTYCNFVMKYLHPNPNATPISSSSIKTSANTKKKAKEISSKRLAINNIFQHLINVTFVFGSCRPYVLCAAQFPGQAPSAKHLKDDNKKGKIYYLLRSTQGTDHPSSSSSICVCGRRRRRRKVVYDDGKREI